LLLVLLGGCTHPTVPPAPVQEGGFRLETLIEGLDQPTFIDDAGDGSGLLYVLEQRGIVKAWDGRAASVFLDLTDRVLSGGEQGLLGLAFDPQYAESGRLFVHYTDLHGDTTVSEFHRLDASHADPASERILLHVDQPYPNHNGGMLTFGPDGMLWLGLGDGGAADDPGDRAQEAGSLLGKLLRIDVDGTCAPVTPPRAYCIPADNPFATRAEDPEEWDLGLRNPWRFSFDRGAPDGAGAGDLWIGDVGQNTYEEVDHESAGGHGGLDYGWSRYEGNHLHEADRDAPDAVSPVAEYSHAPGGHCSVTGGYVYRGAAIPSLEGAYLFGDYCSGVIWTLRPDGAGGYAMAQVMDTDHNISSFGEDAEGELYVVDHGGQVLKVVAA
jgi:glucose/arabinose dehydrogenase